MNIRYLLEKLGEGIQFYKIDKGYELYDLHLNLIATITEKDGNIKYSINKGFNKLSRMKRRMVLYELKRFCQEETEKGEGRYDKV